MPNMTPFEIRLELLKMAKEMLEQEYFNKMNAIQQKYSFQIEEAVRKGEPLPDMEFIPYPSDSEITAKANCLNKFVSER